MQAEGGAIRRLTAALSDPLGYSVNPVAAPNVVEKSFNYLWRFWTRFPKQGRGRHLSTVPGTAGSW